MFARFADAIRKLNDSWQRPRRLNHAAMATSAKRIFAVQSDDEVQALVKNLWEWPGWVECQGRQYRHDLLVEIIRQPFFLFCCPVIAMDETNTGIGQLREEFVVEQLILLLHQF